MYNRTSPRTILLILIALVSGATYADEPVNKSYFGDVAIGGKDTVAYHQQSDGHHEVTEGVRQFVVEWKGAKWRFASREDSEAFASNPEMYAPAYNGFCANALSVGNGLVKTDGTNWQIYGDQLFLFYAEEGRERWLTGDYKAFKADADIAWRAFTNNENQ